MPGEEMEITTDFGHTGFGEDIDIDLDFAVGQPDEDLELADFDQGQEMQNFNTDTRDELMAEGDDASYGMVDADDIEHNEGATAANDIEIDLGDPEENLWHHSIPHGETLEPVVEIDYVEDADVDNSTAVNIGEASWLEASTYQINNANEVELAQVEVAALDAASSHPPQDSAIPAEGVDAQDFGLFETRDDAKEPSSGGNDNGNQESIIEGTINEQQTTAFDAEPPQPAEGSVLSKDDLQDNFNDVQSNGDANAIHEVQEHEQYQTDHNEVSEPGHTQNDVSQREEKPATPVASVHGSASEHSDQQEDETGQQDPSLGGSEQQLGGDSYAESANGPESVQSQGQEENKAHDADGTHTQTDHYDPGNENAERTDANEDGQILPAGKAHVEHPLSIATRHEMYISYGQTDYRLFAKSEDDDPNQYFLRDMSAMELPLGQFLSNLREIVAEEVSVLDELVMHVDGLGLEFSESSTSDMLEEFTFGDILSLYDKLVKNDGAESAPCLYMYLMVRPNCRQRLVALLDSASAGRGLSEVAVYREMTPDPDEQPDNPEYHSSYASSEGEEGEEDDETRHGSNSLTHGEEGEDSYEYEDNNLAGDEDEEHDDDGVEEQSLLKSSAVHTPAAEANPEQEGLEGQAKESEEISRQNTEENPGADVDGEVIDFSDDELDLSSLKQGKSYPYSPLNFSSFFNHTGRAGCQCQDCFELSLDQLDISMPDTPTLFSPAITVTHRKSQYQSGSSSPWSIVSAAQPSTFLDGTESFRIITNSYFPQDQQTNASPQGHDRVNHDESNGVTTAEHNVSNQHTPRTNELADTHSEVTSATVTLNGDDNDEIDYSDDDGEVEEGQDDPPNASDTASTNLKTPIDDEITWESDDEDVKNETTTAPKEAPKTTVQVSPSSGKRRRSNSDLLDGSTEQNDVKRRRPS
ncbi:uncharacterized protein GGS22DRAFT_190212 [Annulohypoxylon maeteangense]|uniref:uncharacterized protein n=1 Tax=Annulohypoxylon maeteangense TaxID=1927788 RepID=UPI002007FD1A|nr:uncharacterized protein GGS22DRAFT_190212 [Annulohypoxylon maeteangense]KAI0883554.1 hypothetical protein GGS22DRAFT_190212 [Annulohypoxylon maeteangense]